MTKLIVYRGSGEWSALYVDGDLDTCGDHYLIDERISDIAGVELRYGDTWWKDGGHTVAPTIDIADQWAYDEFNREKMAEKMRSEAKHLEKRAQELLDQS